MVAPAAMVESVTVGDVTASAAVMAYVLDETTVVSEEVATVTASPVEVVDGLETALAVTSTASPAAMLEQPPPTVRVVVSPPLLVIEFSNPHCVPVVTSSTV